MNKLFDKINKNEVYIIAEISANHGGSLEHALEIVRQAARAGADCVKIQTYTADSITIDCDKEYFRIKGGLWDGYKLYDLYRSAATPYEWHKRIKDECGTCGVDFLSTPFDSAAVDFLEKLGVEAYKIASFELTDLPLIEYAASKGKTMIISTGMGNPGEIQDAVDACRRAGNGQIVLLKCCSQYPAPWEDMRLGNIPDMKKRFGVPVGLSDHSKGSLGAVAGVALGACVIEKHVRLAGVESADSAFSMTIEEFRQMARDVKNAKLAVSGPDYTLTEGEKSSAVLRRSIFAVKDIAEGETFTSENLRIIRPGYGAAPKRMEQFMGKRAAQNIQRGEPVTDQHLLYSMKSDCTIRTERLLLREIAQEDTDLIVKWRSDPNVCRYFRNPHELTVKEHMNWYREIYEGDSQQISWIAAAGDSPVGVFSVRFSSSRTAEVSYLTALQEQRKGYAAEAVGAIEGWTEMKWGAEDMLAEIHVDNVASVRFIEKMGFHFDCRKGSFAVYRKKLNRNPAEP